MEGRGGAYDASVRLFLGLLVVSTLAHLSIARWLRRVYPRIPVRVLYGVACFLAVLPAAVRAVAREHVLSPTLALVAAFTMLELSVAVFGTVLLAVARFGIFFLPVRWFGPRKAPKRAEPARASEPEPEPEPGPEPEPVAPVAPVPVTRRIVLERAAGVLAYGASASLLGWGMVRGRHDFHLEEVVVKVPGLSRKLDGYTIVQISDIHVGSFIDERELDLGFETVRRAKGDVLVATGDLMDSHAAFTGLLARKLRDLPFRDGVYGILGNHDHFAGGEAVRSGMAKGGVRVLVNESEILRKDEGGIALVGVDDLIGSRYGGTGPLFYKAIENLAPDIPRILLAHQPDAIDWSPGGFALQLSGHTHGGQVNPGFRPIDFVHKYVSGLYQVGATTLYVNRGFGVVGPPARIQAPPEVTRIVLVSG